MSLQKELSAVYEQVLQAPAAFKDPILKVEAEFSASFDPSKTIQPGDRFPAFTLQDATGKEVTLDSLLAQGHVLISFYRGEWCPYCNLELRALQKLLPEFTQKGVNLVAISPELPDQSLSTSEKNGLAFPVLSDVGNRLARQLGILFAQPDDMRAVFAASHLDWQRRYGDDSLEVPVPATILLDRTGTVRNVFVDPAWRNRLEPATALGWVDKL